MADGIIGAGIERFIRKNPSVEFIECQFVDLRGNYRDKTLSIEAIKKGSTGTDGSSVYGNVVFSPTESDLVLIPDISTLHIIPWSTTNGAVDTARVICNVFYPAREGEAPKQYEGCSRSVLANVESRMNVVLEEIVRRMHRKARIKKFHAHFSPELEFILVPKEYDYRTLPQDSDLANNHYFMAAKPRIKKTLREISRYLSSMGMKREASHNEVSTFQYEIGIEFGNALQMADAIFTLKYIIGNVAELNDLVALFAPKFNASVNGSGMHVHQNLAVTILEGKTELEANLFFDRSKPDCLSDLGRSYIAGLLKYAREITAITNPTLNSYARLVPGAEAPTYVGWDWQNRTALSRGHSEGRKSIRVEYRAPDPMCNPYLAFAAMLSAGLQGIKEDLELPKADKKDYYHSSDGVQRLPGNLHEALQLMNASKMLRVWLSDYVINAMCNVGMEVCTKRLTRITPEDLRESTLFRE